MRSSKNYVMTAYVESASDMLELERIRKVVRTINKQLRKKSGDSPGGSPQQFMSNVKDVVLEYFLHFVMAEAVVVMTLFSHLDMLHTWMYMFMKSMTILKKKNYLKIY